LLASKVFVEVENRIGIVQRTWEVDIVIVFVGGMVSYCGMRRLLYI
jgi:hypothetical protein